jgi:hypothetical protein
MLATGPTYQVYVSAIDMQVASIKPAGVQYSHLTELPHCCP